MTTKNPQSNLKFRIVFVSPFFELEIKSGMSNWQSVHSQTGKQQGGQDSVTYPMLKFTSFAMAMGYAKDNLGLTNMDTGGFFSMFASPPASFLQGSKMQQSKVNSAVMYVPSVPKFSIG